MPAGMREYILRPGYIYFSTEPTMILTVLGTSVGVTFYDRRNRVGGMNHFIQPWIQPQVQPTALYAQPAMVQLVRMMRKAGTHVDDVEAHVIGGAVPEHVSSRRAAVGQNNVDAALGLLRHFNIPVAGQDVGGRYGRKVMFNSTNGELVIAKVERIRREDWFPNRGDGAP